MDKQKHINIVGRLGGVSARGRRADEGQTHYDASRLGIAPAAAPGPPKAPRPRPVARPAPWEVPAAPPAEPEQVDDVRETVVQRARSWAAHKPLSAAIALACIVCVGLVCIGWASFGGDSPAPATAAPPRAAVGPPARPPSQPRRPAPPASGLHSGSRNAGSAGRRSTTAWWNTPARTPSRPLRSARTQPGPTRGSVVFRPDASKDDQSPARSRARSEGVRSRPKAPAPVSRQPAPARPRITLSGTAHIGNELYADMNGQLLSVGDTLDGAKVIRIDEYTVEMEWRGQTFQVGIGDGPVETDTTDTPASPPER